MGTAGRYRCTHNSSLIFYTHSSPTSFVLWTDSLLPICPFCSPSLPVLLSLTVHLFLMLFVLHFSHVLRSLFSFSVHFFIVLLSFHAAHEIDLPDKERFVLSGSMDCCVKIWALSSGESNAYTNFVASANIEPSNFYCHGVKNSLS